MPKTFAPLKDFITFAAEFNKYNTKHDEQKSKKICGIPFFNRLCRMHEQPPRAPLNRPNYFIGLNTKAGKF